MLSANIDTEIFGMCTILDSKRDSFLSASNNRFFFLQVTLVASLASCSVPVLSH